MCPTRVYSMTCCLQSAAFSCPFSQWLEKTSQSKVPQLLPMRYLAVEEGSFSGIKYELSLFKIRIKSAFRRTAFKRKKYFKLESQWGRWQCLWKWYGCLLWGFLCWETYLNTVHRILNWFSSAEVKWNGVYGRFRFCLFSEDTGETVTKLNLTPNRTKNSLLQFTKIAAWKLPQFTIEIWAIFTVVS